MKSALKTVSAALAFTLCVAVSPQTATALPAGGTGAALQKLSPGVRPATAISHRQCGRKCLSARKSVRSKGHRGTVRYRRHRGRDGIRSPHRSRVANQRRHRNFSQYRRPCGYHCDRRRHRHGRYVYRHLGWWYSRPWWVITVPSYRYGHHYDRHTAYCLRKYRSYDPITDTYVAYSGRVRRCISPYR